MEIDPAGLIAAMTGLVVGCGGLWLSARAGKEKQAEQKVARELSKDQHDLDEVKQINEGYRNLLADQRKEIHRKDIEVELKLKSLMEARAHIARLYVEIDRLTEAVVLLRDVVLSETARVAGDKALIRVESFRKELLSKEEHDEGA